MKTLRPVTWSALCVAALVVCCANRARAGPLFELMGGTHGEGGMTARVSDPSSASTYFNPALLTYAQQSFIAGLYVLSDHIDIRLDPRRDASANVPEGVNLFAHGDGSPISPISIPTVWLEEGLVEPTYRREARPRQSSGDGAETRVFQTVGLVNEILDGDLVLALHAAIPLHGFTSASAFYNDEREQFFSNSLHPELYSDRLSAAELAFGFAARVFERLSLGMSFTLSLKNTAATPVFVSDAARLDDLLINSQIDVSAAVAPHFGAVFEVMPRLRLAATFHTVQAFEIDASFTYLLNSGMEQASEIGFTHSYYPWNAALGVAYDLLHAGDGDGANLALVGTLQYSDWHSYRDRHDERPHPDYAWSGTFTPSVGARYGMHGWQAFLDATYVPTPVPGQTGRTNYVDNDRIGSVGGFGYRFKLLGVQFRAGAQVQVHRLLARSQRKLPTPENPHPNPSDPEYEPDFMSQLVVDEVPDEAIDLADRGAPAPGREGLQTNNPGWPGFASDGWIFGGGVHLSVMY